MSEPKFTKGDWLYQDGWNALYTSSGNTVCDLSGSTTNEHMDYNGHLLKVAPKLYKALEGTNNELHHAIIEINRLLAERVTCATEDEPDWWDQQTVYENAVLLAEARGEL